VEWLKRTLGLGGGGGKDTLRDQRRYLRAQCLERIMVVLSEQAVSVLVTELSLMGMRIRLPRKLEVDDLLTFRAHREVKKGTAAARDAGPAPPPLPGATRRPGPLLSEKKDLSAWGVDPAAEAVDEPPPADDTESEPVPFKARVVWVRKRLETDEYEAGLSFTEIVNHERDRWSRQVLRGAGVKEQVSQRRENIRVLADLPLHYRTSTGYEGDGTVLDLSPRGLQARVTMELTADSTLVMLISTGASGTSVQGIKGHVTRLQREKDGSWRIGVMFDELSARDKRGVERCLAWLMKKHAGG